MSRVPRARGIANALVVALLVGLVATQAFSAFATHQPADKAVASGSTIQGVRPATTTAGIGTDANNILTASVKTAAPTDLQLQVTLECSILTTANIPGSTTPGTTQTGSAEGAIRVWVVVDDTYIVPINNISGNPQPGTHSLGDDDDKVTFCNRMHEVRAQDTESVQDGLDAQRHFIRTKDANAFNWVALNLGRGPHVIDVRADLTTSAVGTGSSADGFVGNRLVLINPSKMANDISI